MFLQAPEAGGSPSKFQLLEQELQQHSNGLKSPLETVNPVFPFGTPRDVSKLAGSAYITAQTLVQQVAYTLSDKLFTYSPESFALDDAVMLWSAGGQKNAHGLTTSVNPMETRLGAVNVLLGYVLSSDFDPKKRELAQSIIASTATLTTMHPALDQLALVYAASSPFVAHVAAVDYETASSKLVTDYVSAIHVAQETGTGLIASFSAHEAQHMALFATLAATVLPTVHVYDGVGSSRESTRVVEILGQGELQSVFTSVLKVQRGDNKKTEQSSKINRILRSLNFELQTAYSLFEYEGHEDPEAVLVVFGSVESSLATQVASSLSKSGKRVGVIAVRVYRPFSESHFLEALPKSIKRVAVLGQVTNQIAVEDATIRSHLYTDVVAAITMSDAWSLPPPITDIKYAREHVFSPKQFAWVFDQIVHGSNASITIPEEVLAPDAPIMDSFDLLGEDISARQYIFWDCDDSASTPAPAVVARALSEDPTKNATFSASYDNVPLSGTLQSEIRTSSKILEAHFHVEAADVTVVNDVRLLDQFDVLSSTKVGGKLLLKSNIKNEELENKLPAPFRRDLITKNIDLYILDPSASGGKISTGLGNALVQLAFYRVADMAASLERLSAFNLDSESVHSAAESLDTALRKFEVPKEWATAETEDEATRLPTVPRATSFTANNEKNIDEPKNILKSSQSIAQALSFKEAYGAQSALRPNVSVENFVIRVQENRRLTPANYDRNIFHIEFDLTGTGMVYKIGESLGIHAHNNADEVAEFIKFYGLNADDIVEVPSKDDPDFLEARTVFQALLQNVDIFGRPPKKFYESLAEYAEDAEEKKALLALCSPDGAAEFKRRAEVDTVTYADILLEYPSAHPEFHDLVKIVAPMKRREYSIASSQKVNPNSVHLLIVVVNWTDPKGRDRFGQATRYLSQLPVGAEITVSVKPSVMKLPASPTAPLIMAGLGTGLAPFRAFVQYRAWQKSQGMDIGSVLLYMGSRHQREEYLYGEEWEAYQAAGIVTLLGRAFSRDQKEKIYIQDRMRETLNDIIKAYIEHSGAFYLCGPTWPVPDVTEVLQEAIETEGKRRGAKVDGRKKIEELKEGLRYVLEVY